MVLALAVGPHCAHSHVAMPESGAEAACRALVEAYAMARDQVDVGAYAALFARGAEFVMEDTQVRGPTAIAAQMQQRARGTVTRHLMSTAHFHQEGPEKVTGLSYFIVYAEPVAEDAPSTGPIKTPGERAVVEYHDEFVLVDGTWKFLRREVKPIFVRP